MEATQFSQARSLTPLSLSHLCSRYLQMRFQIELNARSTPQIGASMVPSALPLLLPVALASELDRVALILADAFLNPGKYCSLINHASHPAENTLAVKIDWDVSRYAEVLPKKPSTAISEASQKREAYLLRTYPPLNKVRMSRPCIICDVQGIIMAWYLPGILDDFRQVGLFNPCQISMGVFMCFRVK